MSATRVMKKPLQILCLHGFRTNSQVMKDQMRGLRDALGENAEFVYLNAPFEASGPTDSSVAQAYSKDAVFYEWGHLTELKREPIIEERVENTKSDEQHPKKIRYKDNGWYFEYAGFDECRALIEEQLPKLGPFDAVVGFSQGAVLATMLNMWYLHHHQKRWWNLCVLVSAPRVRGVEVRSLFEDSDGTRKLVPFHSIHVYGKKDPVYKACLGMAAMYGGEQMCVKKLVFEHESGHRFPPPKHYSDLYTDLAQRIQEICQEERDKDRTRSTLGAKL